MSVTIFDKKLSLWHPWIISLKKVWQTKIETERIYLLPRQHTYNYSQRLYNDLTSFMCNVCSSMLWPIWINQICQRLRCCGTTKVMYSDLRLETEHAWNSRQTVGRNNYATLYNCPALSFISHLSMLLVDIITNDTFIFNLNTMVRCLFIPIHLDSPNFFRQSSFYEVFYWFTHKYRNTSSIFSELISVKRLVHVIQQ